MQLGTVHKLHYLWQGPDQHKVLSQLPSVHSKSALKQATNASFPIPHKFSIHTYPHLSQHWIISANWCSNIKHNHKITIYPVIHLMKHTKLLNQVQVTLVS